tara:strand:+ start:4367 stop:5704 length:1338 start_codon:yes stop_codon:yes gene_type:complete
VKFSDKNLNVKALLMFLLMFGALLLVGIFQSWNLMLAILNLCLISAVMALGVNLQWGYAGLFNAGIMGFAALGGLAAMLVTKAPVIGAWQSGGYGILLGFSIWIISGILAYITWVTFEGRGRRRYWYVVIITSVGYVVSRFVLDPAILRIESFDPAAYGYLGGAGLPVLLSWIVGGILAASVAFFIGKITLGLRSDYLAIATLGISEIVIFIFKNEDWLTRGVKNVTGVPRPVPYEIELQSAIWFQNSTELIGVNLVRASSLFVKLCYTSLFLGVLLVILWLCERALNSPWGRMMNAIRDNETAASAMGKNVTARHLQTFVIGSAIVGIAGAMLVTLDGQFNPSVYHPLRFTFLIWVMVIVGGSGNNYGAILGGFIVWFFWIEAETIGNMLVYIITLPLENSSELKAHFISTAPQLRLLIMGLVLLLFLRFSPRGLIPEKNNNKI